MTLAFELEHYRKEFTAKATSEVFQVLNKARIELAQSSVLSRALKTGSRAPFFTLKDASGREVSLSETLKQGPVILKFYRGGWCPYCNLELRAYERILPLMRNEGIHLIAVSPQLPDESLLTQEKNSLAYPVLSDNQFKVTDQYGLNFCLTEYLVELYKKFGIQLDKVNCNGEWKLPLPATYIIDQDGIIRERFIDIDYRIRLEPKKALDLAVKTRF